MALSKSSSMDFQQLNLNCNHFFTKPMSSTPSSVLIFRLIYYIYQPLLQMLQQRIENYAETL